VYALNMPSYDFGLEPAREMLLGRAYAALYTQKVYTVVKICYYSD